MNFVQVGLKSSPRPKLWSITAVLLLCLSHYSVFSEGRSAGTLLCRQTALPLPHSHAKQKVHWAVLPGAARSRGRRGLCPWAPSWAAGLWGHLGHGKGQGSKLVFRGNLADLTKGAYNTGCLQKRLGTAWPFPSCTPVFYVTKGGV